MSETVRIILLLVVLVLVYVLTRKYHLWRMKRTYSFIIRDLESRGSVNRETAADLPYGKLGILSMGTRDYRPKALEYLVAADIVAKTESGKYYLRRRIPEDPASTPESEKHHEG